MFHVTDLAKQKLAEAIYRYGSEPDTAVRLLLPTPHSSQINLIMDQPQRGDFVVKKSTGERLLVIAPEIYSRVEGMVLDYTDREETPGFLFFPRSATNGGPGNKSGDVR